MDRDTELRRLDALADLLDTRFRVLGIRFGLDPLIGLIPGLGDVAMIGPSAYVIARAARLGAPRRLIARMVWNVAVETIIGSIPVIGDMFDIAFKANRRNVEILRRHLRAGR